MQYCVRNKFIFYSILFYSISELSNYNSLAAVGSVAVCEISMMICEIAPQRYNELEV